MNKVIWNLFLILALSNIVLAASSINVGFTIGNSDEINVEESIKSQNLFYDYGFYLVAALVILIIGSILLIHKKGKKSKKTLSKKKIKKKVSTKKKVTSKKK